MPGESYRWRLRSLLLCLCYVFRALINSLVCWFLSATARLFLPTRGPTPLFFFFNPFGGPTASFYPPLPSFYPFRAPPLQFTKLWLFFILSGPHHFCFYPPFPSFYPLQAPPLQFTRPFLLFTISRAPSVTTPSPFWDWLKKKSQTDRVNHSSGAVWESTWPSWAFRPNEPYVFRGRKAILNHAHALVSVCP